MFRQVVFMLLLAAAVFQAQLPVLASLAGMSLGSVICRESADDTAPTPTTAEKAAIPCAICVTLQVLSVSVPYMPVLILALVLAFVLYSGLAFTPFTRPWAFTGFLKSRAPPL